MATPVGQECVCVSLTAVSQVPKGLPDTEEALNKSVLVCHAKQVRHWPETSLHGHEVPFEKRPLWRIVKGEGFAQRNS